MNINLTLFAQMIAFAVFVGFCMKFIWPPIVTALGRGRRRESGERCRRHDEDEKRAHVGRCVGEVHDPDLQVGTGLAVSFQ